MLDKLFALFQKKEVPEEPVEAGKALMFIDYEHWYYSYRENFDMKPDIKTVFHFVRESYDIDRIFLFGDLTRSELKDSLAGITSADAEVIDTGETFFHRKKSVTDFVMLDHIYRNAVRQDVSTFILLSGDGHFRFAAQYLRDLGKEVILYAVMGSTSKALRELATDFVDLPLEDERYRCYFRMVGEQMAYLTERTSYAPTFLKTAEAVARNNKVPCDRIIDAMRKMLDIGYLTQKDQVSTYGRDMRVLKINWDKMIEDGIWDPDRVLHFEKN